jgi:hypothetical protein
MPSTFDGQVSNIDRAIAAFLQDKGVFYATDGYISIILAPKNDSDVNLFSQKQRYFLLLRLQVHVDEWVSAFRLIMTSP